MERLVIDTVGARERGALPLLQDTLVSLWNRYLRQRLLTLADYDSLGSNGHSGLQTILRSRADNALAGLNEEQRKIAPAHLSASGRIWRGSQGCKATAAIGCPEHRQCRHTDLRAVLELLVDNSLLSIDRDLETGAVVVDLAHEMIIDAWPRLEEWLDSYQAMEMMRRSLVLAAVAWRENSRDESYLFTGKRLTQAAEWASQWQAELRPQEQEFMTASALLAAQLAALDAHAVSASDLLRWAAAGVAAVIVVALIGWAANAAWREWMRRTTGTTTVPVAAGPAQLYDPATDAWRDVTLPHSRSRRTK